MMIGIPTTIMGMGSHILANGPKKGAQVQNIREMVEADPTACARKFVGYNSAVIR